MGFWKRLRVYIIGFGLGLLLTYMFFGNRGCGGWLPGNRVKASITESNFLMTQNMNCRMETANFTLDSLVQFIVKSDVVFSKSDVKGNPKTYYLTDGVKVINFVLDSEESIAYMVDLPIENYAQCDSLDNKKRKQVKLPLSK